MGSSSSKSEVPKEIAVDWSGRSISEINEHGPPPDPSILNEVAEEDRFADIDYQAIPMRMLESIRKKIERESVSQCKPDLEEVLTCTSSNMHRPSLCKPLLREFYNCCKKWRDDNEDLYYDLVKKAIDGDLLDKHKSRHKMYQEEWKKRFPDQPMPRSNIPTRSPGEVSKYVHEMDKDLVTRDLAEQKLEEIDAAVQGLTFEEYKELRPANEERKSWTPTF